MWINNNYEFGILFHNKTKKTIKYHKLSIWTGLISQYEYRLFL